MEIYFALGDTVAIFANMYWFALNISKLSIRHHMLQVSPALFIVYTPIHSQSLRKDIFVIGSLRYFVLMSDFLSSPKSGSTSGGMRRTLSAPNNTGELRLTEGMSVFCNNELGKLFVVLFT